jgi:hypothetical protein
MITGLSGFDELANYYPSLARESVLLRQIAKIWRAGFWRPLPSSFRRLRQVDVYCRFRFEAMASGYHESHRFRYLNSKNVEISKAK